MFMFRDGGKPGVVSRRSVTAPGQRGASPPFGEPPALRGGKDEYQEKAPPIGGAFSYDTGRAATLVARIKTAQK